MNNLLQRRIDEGRPLPNGRFILEAPLRLRSGMQVRGSSTTLVQATPDTILLAGEAEELQDMLIDRITLEGPGRPAREGRSGAAVRLSAALIGNVTVTHLVGRGIAACGVLFDYRGQGLFKGIHVARCAFVDGAWPEDTVLKSNFKDIYFYGHRFEDITVEDCRCAWEGPGSGNDSGIGLVCNGHLGHARDLVFARNECSGHARHGIVVTYGNLEAFEVVATGNTCTGNGWAGIYANQNSELVSDGSYRIEDNTCMRNGIGGAGDDPEGPAKTIRGGIVLNGAHHARVDGNTCTGNGYPARDPSAQYAAGIRVRGRHIYVGDHNRFAGNAGGAIARWPQPFEDVRLPEQILAAPDAQSKTGEAEQLPEGLWARLRRLLGL